MQTGLKVSFWRKKPTVKILALNINIKNVRIALFDFPYDLYGKFCLCGFCVLLLAYSPIYGKSFNIFLLRMKRSWKKVYYNFLLSSLFQKLLQAKVEFSQNLAVFLRKNIESGFFAPSELFWNMKYGKSVYIFLFRIERSTKKV